MLAPVSAALTSVVDAVASRLLVVRVALRSLVHAVRATRRELLLSAAMLGGWYGITLGIANLVHRPDVVWPLSLGLLGFALSGVKLLFTVARDGLYTLTQKDSE